jgi:carbon storage regulator
MLVLARKKGESIMIGDHIELVFLGTDGETARIGIKAPKNIEIYRREIYDSIQQSNREATQLTVNISDLGLMMEEKK